jgi:hypothetical protein
VRRTRVGGCGRGWGFNGREKLGVVWWLVEGELAVLPAWLVYWLLLSAGRLASRKGLLNIFQTCGLVVRLVWGELLSPSYTG